MTQSDSLNSRSGQFVNEGSGLDFKRVLFRALRLWYVVIISLLIALTYAYFKNRYAPKIYPVSASIIIKEAEQTSGAELLYSNELVNPYRNYFNEIYILKSFPLISMVVKDLNFGSSFYREGEVLTSEIYKFPVSVNILNTDQVKSCRFVFTPVDDKRFKLAQEGGAPATFLFGDTISYQSVIAVFKVIDEHALLSLDKSSLIFSYTAPEYLAGAFVSKVSASWAEKNSGVMLLSSSGENPAKEIDFINGLINRYQQYDLENKNEIASRTISFISDQLDDITDSLRHVENLLEGFKGENFVTDLGAETSRVYEQMEQVELQRTELILRQNYYKYLTDYIQNNQTGAQVILPSSVGISDPLLNQFISEMIDIQMSLKMNVASENPDNPLVRKKRERLQEIRNNIIESIKNQEGTDKIKRDALNSRIKGYEQQLSNLPRAERQYVAIRRNYSLLENLYIFLLQKRAEASISRASNVSDIQVVNPPMAGAPISPKPGQNYLIACIAGLALPLAFFVLLELVNTKIQSKEDIEKISRVPFIGGVGHKKSGDNRTVLTAPKSAVAESFRALRSNLAYFLGDKKNVVVLISSSISGEGKTFTTVNLATVLALSGNKTLIVGADLRKPKLYDDFKLSNQTGLSTYLAGMHQFDDVLQFTEHENLHLVSGGPVPPNPSELILGKRMDGFIEEARKRYDYVIIDSPPLAIVADAFVLCNYADHMLFLTRQNYTPKDMVQSLEDYYKNGRLKNISIVLNDIYRSGPGYGYGYGYGYGADKKGHGYYSE